MNNNLFESGAGAVKRAAQRYGGRYAWCAASISRWKKFCSFCNSIEVLCSTKVNYEIVKQYAESISDCATSTQHNYISVVNVVMSLLNSNWVSVSPKKMVGKSRRYVREDRIYISPQLVEIIANQLVDSKHPTLESVVNLAFYFGLRRREAALLDIKCALDEAYKNGWIDISRGTKGGRGRSVCRRVPVGEVQLAVLQKIYLKLNDRRCLVPNDMTYKKFSDYISNQLLPVLKQHGITRLHDLRAAYACNRYHDISGCLAPRNQSDQLLLASSCEDTHAREIITGELGHGRIQIVSSYVGRKVRKNEKS